MDTASDKGNGKFLKMMKRILSDPDQIEEGKDTSHMRQDSTESRNFRADGRVPVAGEPGQNGSDDSGERNRPEDSLAGNGGLPDNTTVISPGTVIVGDIKSDSDIEMLGTVTGNINTTGNVKITGKQIGDVQCTNIDLSACQVRGSLSTSENISIDSDSVIVGDIKCGNLSVDGKLKGNIHAMGNVSCQSNSVIIGDITSTTISVSGGAKLCGKMEISDGGIETVDIPASDLPEDSIPAKK